MCRSSGITSLIPLSFCFFFFCNFSSMNELIWWKFSQLSLPWLFEAIGRSCCVIAWKLLVEAMQNMLSARTKFAGIAGLYSAFKLQTLSTWVSWKLASSPRHNYYAAGKKNIYMIAGTKEKSQRKSMHLTIIGFSLLSETTRNVRFLLWQTRHVLAASCRPSEARVYTAIGLRNTHEVDQSVGHHPCFRFWELIDC